MNNTVMKGYRAMFILCIICCKHVSCRLSNGRVKTMPKSLLRVLVDSGGS